MSIDERSAEDLLSTRQEWVFGEWRFSGRTLELYRNGAPVPLEPRPARILARLLTEAGRMVTRAELRAFGWPRLPNVADDSLNTCIRQIREALDEEAANPRWIETLRGRGYRFCGTTRVVEWQRRGRRRALGALGAVATAAAAAAAAAAFIALLPLDSAPSHDGATSDLAAIRYRADRAFDAVGALALADDAVAAHPGSGSLRAARAELRVRTGDGEGAYADAREALRLAPELAEAHRALGNLAMLRGNWSEAEMRLMRATRLGADEPESWVARAFLETVTGEFESAARSIDRALDLDPLAPHVLGDVGLLHLWAGRWGDAEASCGRAVRVEPRAVWALGCAFDAALLGGGEARALEWGRRLVARWGDDAAPPASVEEVVRRRAQRATTLTGIDDWSLALLLAASGAPDDAVEALERAARQPHFGVVGIGVDPRFAALRGTPRYERLVARVAPAAVRGNGVLD